MPMNRQSLIVCALLLTCAQTAALAQSTDAFTHRDSMPDARKGDSIQRAEALTNKAVDRVFHAGNTAGDSTGVPYHVGQPAFQSEARLTGGAEFLLVRPHFSEAIAYAQGSQTATSIATEGRELQFGYDASYRVFAGFQLADNAGEFRLTYWRFSGETNVQGEAPSPGQFIVDPFGNIVGSVTIVDPANNLFMQTVTGGNLIRTRASVESNLYDLDFIRNSSDCCSDWAFGWSAGVRIADIDQFYSSTITNGGAFFSGGDFSVDFIGAGPRLGGEVRRSWGSQKEFSVFANTHGALIVGNYVVQSSRTATVPAPFRASQKESLTRTIPMVETEIGATWNMNDSFSISAGWLFQAWFDMGTSGGTFGGLFAGADDSNTMSFDGLFIRGEFAY